MERRLQIKYDSSIVNFIIQCGLFVSTNRQSATSRCTMTTFFVNACLHEQQMAALIDTNKCAIKFLLFLSSFI